MFAVTAPTNAPSLRDWVALIRLDRPVGIWLLLWPTLWGVWAAEPPRPRPSPGPG